jgi:D-beta-D-heptose 7-phosphate kinase/D-beta-D-heptose 1-phosphate adenosyltransferase
MSDTMSTTRMLSHFSPYADIEDRCRKLRDEGHSIVFTNGCFDILHVGHVRYLFDAAELGDMLVVGLNDDDSVGRLKGRGRPIVKLSDRAEVLCNLRSVDFVAPFSDDTPLSLIERVRPDILVKGGDYDPTAEGGPKHIIGSEFVRSYGGRVEAIPYVEGTSTTSIVDRILQRFVRDTPRE